MGADSVRATLYLDPAVHEALRQKAAAVHRSMSEIVNDALRAVLSEDEEDRAAFTERAGEPAISFEEFVARLKADGTV